MATPKQVYVSAKLVKDAAENRILSKEYHEEAWEALDPAARPAALADARAVADTYLTVDEEAPPA